MGADKDGTVHDMITGNITARDFKFTYVSYSTNFRKTARKRLEEQVRDWADHEIFHNTWVIEYLYHIMIDGPLCAYSSRELRTYIIL